MCVRVHAPLNIVSCALGTPELQLPLEVHGPQQKSVPPQAAYTWTMTMSTHVAHSIRSLSKRERTTWRRHDRRNQGQVGGQQPGSDLVPTIAQALRSSTYEDVSSQLKKSVYMWDETAAIGENSRVRGGNTVPNRWNRWSPHFCNNDLYTWPIVNYLISTLFYNRYYLKKHCYWPHKGIWTERDIHQRW